jgi:histidine triad (HIT) family protein
MAYDRNNIFAKILRQEIPAHRVYEDAHTLAFMDVMPQSAGHALVIPKAEAEDIFDLEPEALEHLTRTTQRVAHGVRKAFDPPGVMIAQLSGAAAGQSVFHIHFHVIPRYHGIDMKLHAREMEKPEVLAEHARRLHEALGG